MKLQPIRNKHPAVGSRQAEGHHILCARHARLMLDGDHIDDEEDEDAQESCGCAKKSMNDVTFLCKMA